MAAPKKKATAKKRPAAAAGEKYYDGFPKDWPFPRDSGLSKAQLHAKNAMSQRYGVDPEDVQDETTRGDRLDPAQVALRQQAKNPPVQRGDLDYSGYGRVRDPVSGGVFHHGYPHAAAEDEFRPDPNEKLPRPSLRDLSEGLHRDLQNAGDEVSDMALGPARGFVNTFAKAFPNKNVPPRSSVTGKSTGGSAASGVKPVAQPKKKSAAGTYRPRMADPVSGAKLQQGRPVPAANAAAPDYTRLKTVQPGVQRAGPTGPFGPQYSPADYGRATANGDVMKKGQPVPPVYSGGLNDRIGLGLDAAGRALGMGFGPPAPVAPARRPVAPARAAPTMATNPGAFGRAAPMPPSRRAPAANDATIASVSKGMKNSPGYQDFPPPKKRKG
jgi:hypothetical protein